MTVRVVQMPVQRIILEGQTWTRFLIWFFEKKGDRFYAHSHVKGETHVSFPMYGQGHMTEDSEPRFVGKIIKPMPGALVLGPWKVGEMHGFEADEDGFTLGHLWLI